MEESLFLTFNPNLKRSTRKHNNMNKTNKK